MAIIEMRVHIDCPGCENKIRKALQRLKGVENVEIDTGLQKVTVTGIADQKKVLKTVRKTSRQAEIWNVPYNPEIRSHNYNVNQYAPQQQQNGGSVPGPSGTFYTRQPASASSYNYYKHGYDNQQGYNPVQSSGLIGHQTGAAFSDDNTNAACNIM
uniref:heavy metal-associated isoprenylated plant protein 28 n=1 Tax=Erigeron canadensis TaxID=72917 RepID=UPI001CB98302|nr:heavy metal-associated isoprenylated plant protein 28 [Erigeron canadensis]